MTFSEKLRKARIDKGLTQRELAEESGLSLRTIANYESGERMPKQDATYAHLAFALGVTEESLRNEDSDLISSADQESDGRSRKQAEELIRSFRVAAAGGEFNDEDLDFIKDAMMQTYLDAKRYNQRFRNRKYREDHEQ